MVIPVQAGIQRNGVQNNYLIVKIITATLTLALSQRERETGCQPALA